MSGAELQLFLEWSRAALRVLGVAYLVGGVAAGVKSTMHVRFGARGRGAIAIPASEDPDRRGWRIATALLTLAAGASMLAGDPAAAPLLGALLVQQCLYLIRQFMTERDLARPEQKAAARVSALTTQAFLLTAILAALAAYLRGAGALV